MPPISHAYSFGRRWLVLILIVQLLAVVPMSSRPSFAAPPQQATTPTPISPNRWVMVLSLQPTLTWQTVAGAASYMITIRDANGAPPANPGDRSTITVRGEHTNYISLQLNAPDVCPPAASTCSFKIPARLTSNPLPPANETAAMTGIPRGDADFLGYVWQVRASMADGTFRNGDEGTFQIPPLGLWSDGNAADGVRDAHDYTCDANAPTYCIEPVSGTQYYQGGYWNLYDDLFYAWAEYYDVPPSILKAIAYTETLSGIGPRRVYGTWFPPSRAYLYEPFFDYRDNPQQQFAALSITNSHLPAEGSFPYNQTMDASIHGRGRATIAGYTFLFGGAFSHKEDAIRIPGCETLPVTNPNANLFDEVVARPACNQQINTAPRMAEYRLAASYGLGQILYYSNVAHLRRITGQVDVLPERLYEPDLNIRAMADLLGFAKRCGHYNGTAGHPFPTADHQFRSNNVGFWRDAAGTEDWMIPVRDYNGKPSYVNGIWANAEVTSPRSLVPGISHNSSGVQIETARRALVRAIVTSAAARNCNSFTDPTAPVDLIFVIDTTGSMGSSIAAAKASAINIINTLVASGTDYRIGLVEYKDYGDAYVARTDLAFTNDTTATINAINALAVGGGGDIPEAVFSGMMTAVGFPWRNGAKKAIILMGDAPPHDPEQITNFTSASVIAAANAVDPASIYPVFIGTDSQMRTAFQGLANGTGGQSFEGGANVGAALVAVVDAIARSPNAQAGGPYTGMVNWGVTFNASASTDPDGSIVRYEWDFDANGTFDANLTRPTVVYTYTAPFSGTITLRVTDNDGHTSVGTAAARITRPGQIVFKTNNGLYIINPDGSGERQLTTHPTDSYPSWSPDHTKILFVSQRDGNEEIYVVNADGTGLRRLAAHSASDHTPAWSPDGTQIAFASTRAGNEEIYAVKLDGTNLRRLTTNAATDSQPAWSPDGQRIAFASDRPGNEEVYVMSATGTNVRRLSNMSGYDHFPYWAPDGKTILFSGYHGNADVFTVNPDTAVVKKLTAAGDDYYGSWSPDSKRILFMSTRNGNAEVYVMNADGSGQTRLTNTTINESYANWAPDGRGIVFMRGSAMYMMNADGTSEQRLPNSRTATDLNWWSSMQGR